MLIYLFLSEATAANFNSFTFTDNMIKFFSTSYKYEKQRNTKGVNIIDLIIPINQYSCRKIKKKKKQI